jgi:hypothetical protein
MWAHPLGWPPISLELNGKLLPQVIAGANRQLNNRYDRPPVSPEGLQVRQHPRK